jgi:hypothetical protein
MIPLFTIRYVTPVHVSIIGFVAANISLWRRGRRGLLRACSRGRDRRGLLSACCRVACPFPSDTSLGVGQICLGPGFVRA